MPVYNEQNIIGDSIHCLVEQNIRVHILDNESTDKTKEKVEGIAGALVTYCRFSTGGTSDQLARNQAIGQALREEPGLEAKSDWIIKVNANERWESPFQGQNLREGIEYVDSFVGRNATKIKCGQERAAAGSG
jgi:glycosyltransferase involved in cell wall biosynthesis